jgi:hypothetical protein
MSTTSFQKAILLIDEAHSLDPTSHTTADGKTVPYELHYAQKMTHYLSLRAPSASETLQLAIRAQHFRRWEVPRSSYPMTRVGYHGWRTYLKNRQAEQAAEVCKTAGMSDEDAARVAALVRKEDLKVDEETMALEDVACLVFLDDQFEDFEKNHDEEKIIGILRKTWAKMSEKGRELALQIPMEGRAKELVQKALEGAS